MSPLYDALTSSEELGNSALRHAAFCAGSAADHAQKAAVSLPRNRREFNHACRLATQHHRHRRPLFFEKVKRNTRPYPGCGLVINPASLFPTAFAASLCSRARLILEASQPNPQPNVNTSTSNVRRLRVAGWLQQEAAVFTPSARPPRQTRYCCLAAGRRGKGIWGRGIGTWVRRALAGPRPLPHSLPAIPLPSKSPRSVGQQPRKHRRERSRADASADEYSALSTQYAVRVLTSSPRRG